jgi:VanZ family protein
MAQSPGAPVMADHPPRESPQAPREDAPPAARAVTHLTLYLALAYTALVVYASLSPFSGWRDTGVGAWTFLTAPWPRYVTRFDIALNVAAYVPLGFLATLAGRAWLRPGIAIAAGIVGAVLLSSALEALQGFLPGRVSSNVDLFANAAGSVLGGIAGVAGPSSRLAGFFAAGRASLFRRDPVTDYGLALIGVWFASQLNPSLPLMGIVFFSDGVLAQLAGYGVQEPERLLGGLSVMVTLASVGLLLLATARTARHAMTALVALIAVAMAIKFAAAMLLLKRDAIFLWISQDVFFALACGFLIVSIGAFFDRPQVLLLMACTVAGQVLVPYFLDDHPSPVRALRFFEWNYGQLLNYTGLSRAVAEAWPYAAGLFVILAWRARHRGGPAP